jgi:hypothetical protein
MNSDFNRQTIVIAQNHLPHNDWFIIDGVSTNGLEVLVSSK